MLEKRGTGFGPFVKIILIIVLSCDSLVSNDIENISYSW